MKKHVFRWLLFFYPLLLFTIFDLPAEAKNYDPSPADNDTELLAYPVDSNIDGRIPLVLIHGIHGNVTGESLGVKADSIDYPNWGYWQNYIDYFYKSGLNNQYILYAFFYVSDKHSVWQIARSLRNKIDELTDSGNFSDDKQFVIVAHSMGGLVARSYMNEHSHYSPNAPNFQYKRGGERVSKLITLATPYHGSHLTNNEPRVDGVEHPKWGAAMRAVDNCAWNRGLRCFPPIVNENEENRCDLLFDNYDYSWDEISDYTDKPKEHNELLRTIKHTYDNRIIAYWGYIGENDDIFNNLGSLSATDLVLQLSARYIEDFQHLALNAAGVILQRITDQNFIEYGMVCNQNNSICLDGIVDGSVVLSIDNDGFVPSGSAAFDGGNVLKRVKCPQNDHLNMKGGGVHCLHNLHDNNTISLFDSLIMDLLGDELRLEGGYTHPEDRAIVGNHVNLIGWANNPDEVDYVKFAAYYDGSWHEVFTDYEEPYEYIWNLSGISEQWIELGFDIYAKNGSISQSPEGTRKIYRTEGVITDFMVTSPSPAYPGRQFTFDASDSISGQDGDLQYFWNFDDPGSGSSNSGSGITTSYGFSTSGTFIVKLAIYDSDSNIYTKEKIVDVINPLQVSYSTSYFFGPAPQHVTFTPTTSNQLGEGIDSWTWNFGDGAVLEGEGQPTNVTHEFNENGTYNVTLTIRGSKCTAIYNKQLVYGESNSIAYIDGGTIYGHTEWSPFYKVYVVKNSLNIAEGAKLSIHSGTVVKFQPSTRLTVNGTLPAEGMAGSPIIFTSLKDDAHGGDTNNDGSGATPKPGDWDGIYFLPGSDASVLKHSVVEYAGFRTSGDSYKGAGIYIEGASTTISDNEIKNNNDYGIRLMDASPAIINNTISGHDYYGITCLGASNPGISGNTISENQYGISVSDTSIPSIVNNTFTGNTNSPVTLHSRTIPAIQNNTVTGSPYSGVVISGVIANDSVLTSTTGMPHIISYATIPEGVTLTIEPGTVVKFQPSTRLTVNGTLYAEGTEDSPIIFTSLKDDTHGGDTNNDDSGTTPTPGDWYNLYFTSTSKYNLMDHVIVRYGGNSGPYGCNAPDCDTTLLIETSSLTISNGTFEHSALYGIYVSGASPSIMNSIIRDNGSSGIYLQNTSNPTITGNHISGNRYGIYSAGTSNPSINKNILTGNTIYGLYNANSNVTINAVLNYWGSDTGPVHLANPDGTGDKVSDRVDFNPWLQFANDTDADNLPDDWEMGYFKNLDQIAENDPDKDGLSNIDEYTHNALPNNPDSDGDGHNDGEEISKGSNPLDPNSFFIPGDLDVNGIINLADAIIVLQILTGIEPSMPYYPESDVNGDGVIGLEEVIYILRKISEL